jgi:hypothetical protein
MLFAFVAQYMQSHKARLVHDATFREATNDGRSDSGNG